MACVREKTALIRCGIPKTGLDRSSLSTVVFLTSSNGHVTGLDFIKVWYVPLNNSPGHEWL